MHIVEGHVVVAGSEAPVEQPSVVAQFERGQQYAGRRRLGPVITDDDGSFTINCQRPDCVRVSWDLLITASVGDGAGEMVPAGWRQEDPSQRGVALMRIVDAVADDEPAREYADSPSAEEKRILVANRETAREIRTETDHKFGHLAEFPLSGARRGPALKRGS